MQALVLVGGEGTRLRPLTLTQPKPAVRLVDRPFIRFMVDWLAHHGVTEVVMACGFRAEDLRSALGDRIPGGPTISYLEEDEPLGTAGPIRLAADRGLLGERFLALNGDVLADLDLGALMRMHAEREAVATLGLHPVDDPSSYGLVRRDTDGAVRGFLEKPEPDEIDTDEVNAGTYVIERPLVDLIPPGRSVSIEREIFPRLVGQGLYGKRLEGYWMDIGTPERYLQATWDILERRVRTDAGERLDPAGRLIEDGADLAADAEVGGAVLVESPCAVEPQAVVGPRAVVARGGCVGRRARISEAVLDDGCRLGERAVVSGSILAAGVEVGEGATVTGGSIVGRGARIEPGAMLEGARVGPADTVPA